MIHVDILNWRRYFNICCTLISYVGFNESNYWDFKKKNHSNHATIEFIKIDGCDQVSSSYIYLLSHMITTYIYLKVLWLLLLLESESAQGSCFLFLKNSKFKSSSLSNVKIYLYLETCFSSIVGCFIFISCRLHYLFV